MNRITSAIAILLATILLPAAVRAEQKVASPTIESPGANATIGDAVTPPEASPGKHERQPESEPEWPQPRCEAPAD
jgi:hypothetical protein